MESWTTFIKTLSKTRRCIRSRTSKQPSTTTKSPDMKNLLAILLLASAFTGCKDATETGDVDAIVAPGTNALTSIEWIEPKKDLGTINEGQKLQINFHLKNTGSAPLILQSVVPGCGCTVADY